MAGNAGMWLNQLMMAMIRGVDAAAGIPIQLCTEEGKEGLVNVKQADVQGVRLEVAEADNSVK